MSRPKFVTDEDIARWSKSIDEDLPPELAESPLIREVCYAGLWLCEELDKLKCPEVLITRIQFTAGSLSAGREPWEVHQKVLEDYKNNLIEFETEPTNLN